MTTATHNACAPSTSHDFQVGDVVRVINNDGYLDLVPGEQGVVRPPKFPDYPDFLVTVLMDGGRTRNVFGWRLEKVEKPEKIDLVTEALCRLQVDLAVALLGTLDPLEILAIRAQASALDAALFTIDEVFNA